MSTLYLADVSTQITGGLLTFSDGTSVRVPSLANNGAATPVSFSARNTSYILLKVTAVSSSTTQAGLAEVRVFGLASS